MSSTEPRGVALLTKRSPTVEKCSLNISAMSARSSTTHLATAQVEYTSKPPDARRNGRTQELRDSFSRARGAQRWRFWLKKCRD